jgi:hypothetical protein
MGYTIGDVMTFIGLIGGLLISIWASLVGVALIFPRKATRARTHLESSPWASLILGAALLFLGGLTTVFLLNLHNPLLTFMGWGLIIYMLGIMVIGGSGMALVMGSRMQKMDRRCSELRGLSRSAGLMVLSALVPMFGWAVSVIMWVASMGAGFQAVFTGRKREAIAAQQAFATQTSQVRPSDPPEFHV